MARKKAPKPKNAARAELLAKRAAERAAAAQIPVRPFADLAFEADLVALREFVPSAVAELPLRKNSRPVQLATVLPGAIAALVRTDNVGYIGAQVAGESPDLAADFAESIRWVLDASTGDSLNRAEPDAETPDLTDLIDADGSLEVTVHQDFNWWVPEGSDPDPTVASTISQANGAVMPSARISADVPGAPWWVDAGDKAHIRWVRIEDEETLMSALARLSAAGDLHLGEGSRFAGSFRTHGLLVPVFDLDPERHADEWAAPLEELDRRFAAALDRSEEDLTAAERRARDGLRSRQVTLR